MLEVNQKFGKLKVIAFKEKKNSRNWYICQCECGNLKEVREDRLLGGHTKSCGCLQKEASWNREDLTNKRFNFLTVISYMYTKNNRTYWKCRCICGKEVIKQGKLLKNSHCTSCGCQKNKKKVLSMENKRFGKLTVLHFQYIQNKKYFYLCKCDCGRESIVSGVALRNGNTKSCGCLNRCASKERINIINKTFYNLFVERYLYTKNKKTFYLCKCSCGNERIVTSTNLRYGYVRSCEKCAKLSSTEEQQVLSFIQSIYNGEVKANDRTVIFPKELDIYIPTKNLAIEYDGLYWHSTKNQKSMSYHLQKTMACMKKGIRLIHVYDAEWRDKKEIVKSMILSALGIYERKEYARNCEVREVKDRNTVINFFDENHIQGAVHKYNLCLGLYKNEELLQAVVFGKQHFGRNGDTELYRMVTKKNTQILGGFSKLMKHSPYNTVVSYVALRLFDAKGYLAGNWKIEHQAKPSFCITDGVNMYSRHLFKKERCLEQFDNITSDMTEREMQEKNGFYRLWDCGTYKVRWNRP